MRLVTAQELRDHPNTVAPVSGCRCRECGRNAHRDEPDTMWTIEHSVAYCEKCRPVAKVVAR